MFYKIRQETLVNDLNKLIEAAVKNGGDMGGSYNQCMDELYSEIQNMMERFDLTWRYHIVDTGNKGCFSPYRIELKYKED